MGTIVTYNNSQSDPVKRNTAYLPTAGKYMTGDITITDTGMDVDDCVYQDKDGFIVLNDSYGTYIDRETLEITTNGTYTAPERKVWNKLDVKVPGSALFKSIVNLSVTEINRNDITTIAPYAFRDCTNLTSVNLPNLKSISAHAFENCSNLVTVNASIDADIGDSAFLVCTNLKNIDVSNATTIGERVFQECRSLSGVLHFKKLTSLRQYGFQYTQITTFVSELEMTTNNGNIFNNATSLTTVDIKLKSGVQLTGVYFYNTPLNTLILRSTVVTPYAGGSVFTGTPFAEGGTGGTLYVPSALISSYQSATNWSTILSYPNNQVLPIEGSIYETQYADGTPIT